MSLFPCTPFPPTVTLLSLILKTPSPSTPVTSSPLWYSKKKDFYFYSSDGATIKIPYGVDVLPHFFVLGWSKLNLILLLDQLRLA